jgi:hypothetical protein
MKYPDWQDKAVELELQVKAFAGHWEQLKMNPWFA